MTILTVVVVLLAGTIFGQLTKTDKVIAQHIEIDEGIRVLVINLPADQYTIKHTKSSRMLVEIRVELDNVSEHLLKYLIGTGHYNLHIQKDLLTQTIKIAPNQHLANVLVVKGKEIKEFLHYTLYVPNRKIDYVEEPEELVIK